MVTRQSSATDAGLVHLQDLLADAAHTQLLAEDHGRR
jgi:hypothetical protein